MVKPVANDAIARVYSETRSVHRTAAAFGLSPQTICNRLASLGISRSQPEFSQDERDRLVAEYEQHADEGTLEILASSMSRTKQFLCRKASLLGLTDISRPKPYLADSTRRSVIEWHKNNPHPKGATGIKHTDAAKAIIAEKAVAAWARKTPDQQSEIILRGMKTKVERFGSVAPNVSRGNWKAGWREIGGKRNFYRSRWEANYARYLEWLKSLGQIKDWQHEPETFWFEAIRRGTRSYLPDFRVWENDGSSALHEVKGWMDSRSRTTLQRMAKYHPEQKLILIDKTQYSSITKKASSLIPGWE